MVNLESTKFRAIKSIVNSVDSIYALFEAYKMLRAEVPIVASFENFTDSVNKELESISGNTFVLLGGEAVKIDEKHTEVLNADDK